MNSSPLRALVFALPVFFLIILTTACSGPTMSPARQARSNACLKQCAAAQPRGPDTPVSGEWNRNRGSYDSRTACERSCY